MRKSEPASGPRRALIIDHTGQLAGGEVALARLLSALDRSRFDVRVLLLTEGPLVARLRDEGVDVAVLRASERLTAVGRGEATSSIAHLITNAWRTFALVPRIARAIRGSGADLVVANTLKSAVLTSVAAPLAGRRWAWHLHDRLAPDYMPARLAVAMRMLGRRGPRMIVANSLATRRTIASVPDGRVVVAYPGIEIDGDRNTATSPRDGARIRFGLLGRIAPTKGHLEFLRAAAKVARSHPSSEFVVIGDTLFNDGPFGEQVLSLPDELGIADRVTFTGWVDDPADQMSRLTALVHASPVPEPFGQVLVEAMLAGVPIIGTDAGGVPEIVAADPSEDGVPAGGIRLTPLGILVAPGDVEGLGAAMEWMIEHPKERSENAARARNSARDRFDIRRSARIVEDAWARALGQSGCGSSRTPADIVDTDTDK